MRRLLGAVAFVALVGVAAHRTATNEVLPPVPAVLEEDAQRRIWDELARREPGLRARSAAQFPGDQWSQGDAFHAHELLLARRLAARHEVSLGDILRVWDRGLREGWPGSERVRPSAPQCRPRPVY